VYNMKTEAPSDISIIDGRYAEGKKIDVVFPKADTETDIMFKGLKFSFSGVQTPGNRILLQCESDSTEKGELILCKVSLFRDFHTY